MPITWDARNKRWRFQFNRIISGRRHRASRLLPSGWSRDQAEAYDREQVARLYAVASGIERPIPLISEAVRLYLDHRVPQLANAKACAQSLALLLPDISGHRLDELADIARKYAKAARKADGAPLAPATLRNRLAYLRAAGIEAVNPAEINAETGGKWEDYMREDIKALCDCDGIALLPGWERSRGAHLEVHIAHRLGLQIWDLDKLLSAARNEG